MNWTQSEGGMWAKEIFGTTRDRIIRTKRNCSPDSRQEADALTSEPTFVSDSFFSVLAITA